MLPRFQPMGWVRAALLAGALSASASAAALVPGVYQLHNHPDGNVIPPPYGLRLDELYDVTGNLDIFTFDFDNALSDMKLTYDDVNDKITISGVTYGGRDIGASYAADPYLGVYIVNFVYDVGVAAVPGDDDVYVLAPSNSNFGTIQTPLGHIRVLSDMADGTGMAFRFGDEDDDLGHRGFPGISGWGWLMVDGHSAHTGADDWLFTAELIPEPASALLLCLAGLLVRRR